MVCSAPWATHCDPLADDPETCSVLVKGLVAYCQEIGAGNLQVRTLHTTGQFEDYGFYPQTPYKHHRLDLVRPFEEVQRSFSRNAVRAMVSRARKRGYSLMMAQGPQDVALFHKLFANNRQRLGLPLIPQRFFNAIWEILVPKSANLLFICRDNDVAAGLLVFKYGKVLTLEYAGESTGARQDGVNQLLYWEAVALAAREGYSQVSFGRTSPDNAGLLLYKRHFGTVEEDLVNYRWPVGPTAIKDWREFRLASKAVGVLCRYLPWSGRVALGEIVYRHLL
jgi:hypothetical protein